MLILVFLVYWMINVNKGLNNLSRQAATPTPQLFTAAEVEATMTAAQIAEPEATAETLDSENASVSMVGNRVLSACTAIPDLQIEPLVENSDVVPNAFMGLDLNRQEVDSGLRYEIELPENAYVQYFEAWTGLTWEAVGPTRVTATAWTAWCENAGWLGQQGYDQFTGQHRVLNANNLPEAIGEWITR